MIFFFRITFKICLILAFLIGCEITENGKVYYYYYRGIECYLKGKYDKAISDFTKAIEINPRYAEAYYDRGNAYYKKGQHDKAIADYTRAIEINPRNAEAYSGRGLAYANKDQFEIACSDWKRACELGRCGGYEFIKKRGFCE